MVASICFQTGGALALPGPVQGRPRAYSGGAAPISFQPHDGAASVPRIALAPNAARVRDGSGGLMKDYGERNGHSHFRRLFAGIDDDTMLPHYFMHPLNQPQKARSNRLGGIKRLRKLERRTMWWHWLRYSVESWLFSMSRYNPYRSYRDQLRFGTH